MTMRHPYRTRIPRVARRTLRPLILAALLTLGAAACTENPFESGDAPVTSTRDISGIVTLSDDAARGGAYVWLEGFGFGTYSTEQGTFRLMLPPPATQGVPGGVSGAFRAYAFIGNYSADFVNLAVRDGSFVYGTANVDAGGALYEPLSLTKRFSIETVLSRTRIEADSPRTLSVTVRLQSPQGSVGVWYPLMVDGTEGPMLLHNLGTGEVHILRTAISGVELRDYVQVGTDPYERSMLLPIRKFLLKAGTYEVIPYLLPSYTGVPAELFESLGDDVGGLSPDYVLYPFVREGGILSVVAE